MLINYSQSCLAKRISQSVICFLLFIAPLVAQAAHPDWVKYARVGGCDVDIEMSEPELLALIQQRQAENVSVLEVDSRLSMYLSEAEFDAEVLFLDHVANLAHNHGMKAVAYYPSLEVLTKDGELPTHPSMFKDHPTWVQYSITGEPNVFYGSQEVWVEPGMESAWMSPNSPYNEYYLNRIGKLADTALDGVWVDVPLYLETGAIWAGAGAFAAVDFNTWTISQGLGGPSGYQVPTVADWNDPVFRAWIAWRKENLADFLERVRLKAHSIDPNFMVIVENFPLDYTDATSMGLDGTIRRSGDNFIRVWEVDSVSNTKAMRWASIEEFSNKLAMFKWGAAADRENTSWAFSYGYQPLDAGLVMAAALTVGVAPFEAQTPEMTLSVNSDFRTRWFDFIAQHQEALLGSKREHRAGVWYSSPSRDYIDLKTGGGYGMYVTTTPPTVDPDWWATEPNDSALTKPHLGGYRGAAHAFTQMAIPYKIVTDTGNPAAELANLELLWLPSVIAISDTSAQIIKDYVANGGVVFATGELPGMLDELGGARSQSIFQDLFNLIPSATNMARMNRHGAGLAVYNPNIVGREMFAGVGDEVVAYDHLTKAEQFVRIHVQDDVRVQGPAGIHIEVSRPTATKHHLYITNYSGLQIPLVQALQNYHIQYKAPEGYQVISAEVASPDIEGQSGFVPVSPDGEDLYGFDLLIDQFALVTMTLAEETPNVPDPYETPVFDDPLRAEVVESGLDFMLNKMRNTSAPAPYSYGIFTNYIDDPGQTEIYAHGHHVTAEHMGLMLRVTACLGRSTPYLETYQHIGTLMQAFDYKITNWAFDRDLSGPLISEDGDNWMNSNAPLDDFRVIRGLLEGSYKIDFSPAADLAKTLMQGTYWTSVTDRQWGPSLEFPAYPDGLIGYAWDWRGTEDPSRTPPARWTGNGILFTDPIPVDYQDLFTLGLVAQIDPRWISVLASGTDLLLDAEIPGAPGLFYNGYEANGNWTGDFENRDTNQGKHLKTIQVLWIALHLARASKLYPSVLDSARRTLALEASEDSLAFFKGFYQLNSRVPEYLTFGGVDVEDCVSPNNPPDCLVYGEENLFYGEARIYALLARLALLLDDEAFAAQLIEDKIMTDRISDPTDPLYGLIGVSTAGAGDAEAWNVLESLLTICLEAKADELTINQPPYAFSQNLSVIKNQNLPITLSAEDPNQDPLDYFVVDQPSYGTLSGTAPNLTYKPAQGYTGSDYFTFKAYDGEYDSNIAVISIMVQKPGANNNAPVAYGDTLITNEDNGVSVTLVADDIENDPLTYDLVAQPLHGTLSGSAPNLVYTPDAGFSGLDWFSFKVEDLYHPSNIAKINITVNPAAGGSPTVSNTAHGIAVDGDLSDWLNRRSFGPDPDDVVYSNTAKIDWLEGSLAHDSEKFYLAYLNDGNIELSWGIQVYIDTDQSAATGYKLGDLGADYLIEYDLVRKYTGDGYSWDWQNQGAVLKSINGPVAEYSFPRAWLGDPASFNLFFYGNNEAYLGTEIDTYPDGVKNPGAKVRHFSYSVTAACTDIDFDGFAIEGNACGPIDCDDSVSEINPAAKENCFDGVDNDCDEKIDAQDEECDSPNQPPVADGKNYQAEEDYELVITLTASDPDNDPLDYIPLTQPAHGDLSGTAPNLIYRPHENYNGPDSFIFKANDGELDSNHATISIIVFAKNDAPMFKQKLIVKPDAKQDKVYSDTIGGTAQDVDGDSLSYELIAGPKWLILNPDGTLSGTPQASDVGLNVWTVKVNDGNAGSAQATLHIVVQPIEDNEPEVPTPTPTSTPTAIVPPQCDTMNVGDNLAAMQTLTNKQFKSLKKAKSLYLKAGGTKKKAAKTFKKAQGLVEDSSAIIAGLPAVVAYNCVAINCVNTDHSATLETYTLNAKKLKNYAVKFSKLAKRANSKLKKKVTKLLKQVQKAYKEHLAAIEAMPHVNQLCS